MNVLIPEAWDRDTPRERGLQQREVARPQPRRGRLLTHLLGVLPLAFGVGCALLVSLGRQG